MRSLLTTIAILLLSVVPVAAQDDNYLGCFGNECSPYAHDSVANPYGAGSPYAPNSPTNPYGQYGNPYSPQGAQNPYTTDGASIYNQDGTFRGTLNSNPYDPDSVANPYGRYGSPYSTESPNNPYTNERYNVFGR
jgi:hypothetical protein